MALIPMLLNDLLEDVRRPVNLFDQHFGLGMLHDDLVNPSIIAPLRVGYYRPWRNTGTLQSGVSNIHNDKDGFKVNLDVQQFKPEELTVKMVDDFVVVEGKHEERQDEHGYISRQFQRRYKVPKDVNHEAVKSQLSSDGVLTITVPKLALTDSGKDKVIPITQTQKPALKSAASHKQDKTEKMES